MKCYIFTFDRYLGYHKIKHSGPTLSIKHSHGQDNPGITLYTLTDVVSKLMHVNDATDDAATYFLMVEPNGNTVVACAQLYFNRDVLVINDMWIDRIYRPQDIDSLLLYCIITYGESQWPHIQQVRSSHVPCYLNSIKDMRTMRITIDHYLGVQYSKPLTAKL